MWAEMICVGKLSGEKGEGEGQNERRECRTKKRRVGTENLETDKASSCNITCAHDVGKNFLASGKGGQRRTDDEKTGKRRGQKDGEERRREVLGERKSGAEHTRDWGRWGGADRRTRIHTEIGGGREE